MFVTNHVLSGVLIGQIVADRPVAAFAAGVASHLVLDAMPHWGCDNLTPDGYRRFIAAAQVDGVLGLGVVGLATVVSGRRSRAATLAAMAGAALLDLDKPAMYFLRIEPFPEFVNRLHRRIQNESEEGLRNEFAFGVLVAAVDAAAIALRRGARSLRCPAVGR
ncbi:MAG: hypothetical protein ABSF84_16965 [Acidimicrobiales bacterium]|jgi:hypothetical protein